MSKKVLLTGGAGFIGHLAIKEIISSTDWEVITFDRLSYAGDLKRLKYVTETSGSDAEKRIKFIYHDFKAPIHNELIQQIKDINYIVHIGASSHVTNSVSDPGTFVQDNVVGTFNLLEAARKLDNLDLFYYFSTDEVFGPSIEVEEFKEWDRYNSKNPYSATKAAGEELTIAYANTYSLPSLISHCSNVYGERQHYEKFIPNTIKKILNDEEIIVHTDSNNNPGSRYYLYNDDLAKSILFLVQNYKMVEKKSFEIYKKSPPKVNISGNNLISNLEIVELISKNLNKKYKYKLMQNDPARPGHDIKYGLDTNLLESLGGAYDREFNLGLKNVIDFHTTNKEWFL